MIPLRLAFFLMLALSACGPRPQTVLLPEAAGVGTPVSVFYATTRRREASGQYLARRAPRVRYGHMTVSVPPEHKPGHLELAAVNPDPNRHFIATTHTSYDAGAFRQSLAAELRKLPYADREIIIFVHGFNNTFAEGVYRQAQLTHDLEVKGAVINYSWPSAAHPLGYVHDRDSALFARDGLERLIADANAVGARRVQIVAHSLGAQLTMEAMRQMAIKSKSHLLNSIDGVILLSPDIDIDVFRLQVARIGKLPDPFVIFASERDRALALSSGVNGTRNRLGNLSDVGRVADLDVIIVDVSDFSRRRDLGHFTIGSSPALISIFNNLPDLETTFRKDRSERTGLVPGAVLTVQNATQIILHPTAGAPP